MPHDFHRPVLADAVVAWARGPLAEPGEPARGIYVDVTCGGGGHAARLLDALRPRRAVLLDRDPAALHHARARLAPFSDRIPLDFIHAPFAQIDAVLDDLDLAAVDLVLADLGVSSHQLDTPGRGFSFQADAPLDMRMDPSTGPTAADLVAEASYEDLVRILRRYGEEPDAAAIARAIVRTRPTTTGALVRVVESALGPRRRARRRHLATRTFQALRIAVNRELEQLDALLDRAPGRLAWGGRLLAITYHSLEDRRVKRCFRRLSAPPRLPRKLPVRSNDRPRPSFVVPREARSGVIPEPGEVAKNPRARSARLRVLERRCA